MVALTYKEVLVELKKLGIDTASDLKVYSREYKAYYAFSRGDIHEKIIVDRRRARHTKRIIKTGAVAKEHIQPRPNVLGKAVT